MTVPNVYKNMKAVIKAGERTARIKEAIKEGFLAIKEKFPHRKDRDSVFIRYPTNVIYVGGHTSASPTPIVWVENPHYNRVGPVANPLPALTLLHAVRRVDVAPANYSLGGTADTIGTEIGDHISGLGEIGYTTDGTEVSIQDTIENGKGNISIHEKANEINVSYDTTHGGVQVEPEDTHAFDDDLNPKATPKATAKNRRTI